MSEQRLSKLQKIILDILYKENGRIGQHMGEDGHQYGGSYDDFNLFLFNEILEYFPNKNHRSLSAAISRSIRNLEEKNLVECCYRIYGGRRCSMKLTSKALKLTGEVSGGVNIKEVLK